MMTFQNTTNALLLIKKNSQNTVIFMCEMTDCFPRLLLKAAFLLMLGFGVCVYVCVYVLGFFCLIYIYFFLSKISNSVDFILVSAAARLY